MTSPREKINTLRQNCFSREKLASDPLSAISRFSGSIDELLVQICAIHNLSDTARLSIVALGGYGRSELCPHSDVDLLVLHAGDHQDENTARFIRALWDLGLPLGCVVRSISECNRIMGEDLATDTALLDARFIAGDWNLFDRLWSSVVIPFYLKNRAWFLKEMDTALRDGLYKTSQLLYKVEPNLKNGVCALRGCHRLFWSEKVKQMKRLSKGESVNAQDEDLVSAYHSILKLRSSLHMVAQRRADVLEFSYQTEAASVLGFSNPGELIEFYFFTVARIKRHIMRQVEQLGSDNIGSRFRKAVTAVQVSSGVKLLDGILFGSGQLPPAGENKVVWIFDLFTATLTHKATLSLQLQNLIRRMAAQFSHGDLFVIRDKFCRMLALRNSIGSAIQLMHETGFLEKLIPEFEALRCKVEYDNYHEFTVDQHTIQALKTIDELAQESDFSLAEICSKVSDLFSLRLATLLHDIGKSLDGEHSYSGSVMAEHICDRLGVGESVKESVSFLIRNHLTLSRFAFQRIPEEQAVREFASAFGSAEMLDLLYLLTVADIRSVGNSTWTVWKGTQLFETYERVRSVLTGQDTKINLRIHSLLTHDLIDKLKSPDDLEIKTESFVGFERLTVAGYDRAHFFADVVACLSSEGYNILSAHIHTTPEGKALDQFHVEPDLHIKVSPQRRVENLKRKWMAITTQKTSARKLISERLQRYPFKSRRDPGPQECSVVIDNDISQDFTLVEVRGIDRFGLLYKLAHSLSSLRINIASAKLATQVAQVVDVFYVTGPGGGKINDRMLLSTLRSSLMADLKSER